jgi:imidazolonepropionase-like amidohydrolase
MDSRSDTLFKGSILLRDSVIMKVGTITNEELPSNTQIIEADGKYVIPGLWDTHVHLYKITRQSIPELLKYGITSVRDMGGDTDTIKQIIKDIRLNKIKGPRILFCGPTFESPSWTDYAKKERRLDTIENILRTRINLKDEKDAQRLVDSVANLGVNFIKVRNFKDPETYWALAKAVRKRGLRLDGHAPYSIDPIIVSDSGQVSFDHGWYPSLSGLNETKIKQIIEKFKLNNCVLVPTTITWISNGFTSYPKLDSMVNGPIEIRDSRIDNLPRALLSEWKAQLAERKKANNLKAWNRDVMKGMLSETKRLYDGGVKIMAGSDVTSVYVFPGESLHQELFLFVEEMKLTPYQALETATKTPAEVFHLGNKIGSIKEGKLADLILLEKNPLENIRNLSSIRTVFRNGAIIYQKK